MDGGCEPAEESLWFERALACTTKLGDEGLMGEDVKQFYAEWRCVARSVVPKMVLSRWNSQCRAMRAVAVKAFLGAGELLDPVFSLGVDGMTREQIGERIVAGAWRKGFEFLTSRLHKRVETEAQRRCSKRRHCWKRWFGF